MAGIVNQGSHDRTGVIGDAGNDYRVIGRRIGVKATGVNAICVVPIIAISGQIAMPCTVGDAHWLCGGNSIARTGSNLGKHFLNIRLNQFAARQVDSVVGKVAGRMAVGKGRLHLRRCDITSRAYALNQRCLLFIFHTHMIDLHTH